MTIGTDIDVADLHRRVRAWHSTRRALAAREERGDTPEAAEWEGSDDTANELLTELAAALGWLPEG